MVHSTCHAEGSIPLLCPSDSEKDPDDGKLGLLWASLFSLKAYISSTKKPHFRDTDSFRSHAPPLVANDRNEYLCSMSQIRQDIFKCALKLFFISFPPLS